jgi:SAM-dependent methyltransferase
LSNNSEIIKQLINEHQYYIKPTQLLPFTTKIYYSHEKKINDLSNDIQLMLKYFNQNTYNDLVNIIQIINKKNTNILDIGCGKIKYFNLIKNTNYTGIDYDPICITKNTQKYNKATWFWGNINNENWSILNCPFDGFINKTKYDLIILRNSINFVNNINNFLLQLSQLCHNKTIIYIMLLDGDNVVNYDSDEINIKKIINNEYQFTYSWNSIGTFNDKIYCCSNLIETFNKYGFLMIKFNELDLENNKYNQFIHFHKILQFRFIK